MIGIAIADAVSQGYLDRVAQPGTSTPVLRAQAERVAALQPAADALALQWREFRQGGETDMAKLLRSTTYDGIEVRSRQGRRDD